MPSEVGQAERRDACPRGNFVHTSSTWRSSSTQRGAPSSPLCSICRHGAPDLPRASLTPRRVRGAGGSRARRPACEGQRRTARWPHPARRAASAPPAACTPARARPAPPSAPRLRCERRAWQTSGVEVLPDCIKAYEDMKIRKSCKVAAAARPRHLARCTHRPPHPAPPHARARAARGAAALTLWRARPTPPAHLCAPPRPSTSSSRLRRTRSPSRSRARKGKRGTILRRHGSLSRVRYPTVIAATPSTTARSTRSRARPPTSSCLSRGALLLPKSERLPRAFSAPALIRHRRPRAAAHAPRRAPARARPRPVSPLHPLRGRSDDNAPIRAKMLYASSKAQLKISLTGAPAPDQRRGARAMPPR